MALNPSQREANAGPRRGDQDLFALLQEVKGDFRRTVQAIWPWGEEGTPLHKFREPRRWQIHLLEELTDHQRNNRQLMARGQPPQIYRSSISSGRGCGKTAIEMMICYAAMSTYWGSTVIATANNEQQLTSRTWAELGLWHTLAINSHHFSRDSSSLRPAPWFADQLAAQAKVNTGYYYMLGQLWDKDRPEAFAGVHNPAGLVVTFQEAIGIPDPIWTVTNGFFTEPVELRVWLASANPRKNTGYFYQTHHKYRSYWHTRRIDSRTIEGMDVEHCNQVIEQYGETSVEACAEVTGQFPGESSRQAIPRRLIIEAAQRPDPEPDPGAPLVLGVDVARFGEDDSVIQPRKGRDARSLPAVVLHGHDVVAVCSALITWIEDYAAKNGGQYPDAINIDVGGVGAGVYDIMKDRGYKHLHAVDFGEQAEEYKKYRNRRTEIYFRMKGWLPEGVIAKDQPLEDDIAGPEYGYAGDNGTLILESKEKMKDRGLSSPDRADALALTFATRVARRDIVSPTTGQGLPARVPRIAIGTGYNPWSRDE